MASYFMIKIGLTNVFNVSSQLLKNLNLLVGVICKPKYTIDEIRNRDRRFSWYFDPLEFHLDSNSDYLAYHLLNSNILI